MDGSLVFSIVLLAVSLVSLFGLVFAVGHLLLSSKKDTGQKILWLLVILFVLFGFAFCFLLA